jgi:3-deoxy-D-manno-octulosonate 8-phosphate phosphatase KdsC-like HAD superfamily phosphatase
VPDDVVYVGDDIFDVQLLESVLYGFCPKDAPSIVKKSAITLNGRGGENLVAEVFEHLETKGLLPEYDFYEHLDKVYEIDIKEKF